jgi:hypothetical protein
MVRFAGAFLISLMITNWIYAEFLLIVPVAEPYIKKTMRVLQIPTHDKWPEIASAPGARALGDEVQAVVGKSSLNSFFAAIGIADRDVQRILQRKGQSQRQVQAASKSTPTLFSTGSAMFLESAPEVQTFGGYERFLF